MRARLVPTERPAWGAELDRMGLLLRRDEPQGTPAAALLPYYFLLAALPRIGGAGAWFLDEADRPVGVGFLFPRQRGQGGRPVYTVRYHAVPGHAAPDADTVCTALQAQLGDAELVFYNPAAPQEYASTEQQIGGVDIGRPSADEAAAIPGLQAAIWQSPPEFLYPPDLHSMGFAPGTSLVARVEGQVVGFLLGFRKFGGGPLPPGWHDRLRADERIESQVLGVLPAFRGLRIANLLKKVQAEQAHSEGIGIVNWTSDPLQYPNAALNLGLLRAVAFEFAPDLYPFRNALNRVHASRITLTWLVGSDRVRHAPMLGYRALVLDLAQHTGIVHVNEGLRLRTLEADAPFIAIEVPADWTRLQEDHVDQAQRWREVTDELFARFVGLEPHQYVLTGVGVRNERRYLIGERSTPALFAYLSKGA